MQLTAPTDSARYPTVYRKLMTVCLLGAIYRMHEDADVVSAAVELTLDDPTQFRLYRAIAQGMGGNGLQASTDLQQHLSENPHDDVAKVAMAVSLMLAGEPEWKHHIDNVLATSSDQVVREAAHGVMGFLDSLQLH